MQPSQQVIGHAVCWRTQPAFELLFVIFSLSSTSLLDPSIGTAIRHVIFPHQRARTSIIEARLHPHGLQHSINGEVACSNVRQSLAAYVHYCLSVA